MGLVVCNNGGIIYLPCSENLGAQISRLIGSQLFDKLNKTANKLFLLNA